MCFNNTNIRVAFGPALLSALASRFVAAAGVRPRYTVSIIEKSSA